MLCRRSSAASIRISKLLMARLVCVSRRHVDLPSTPLNDCQLNGTWWRRCFHVWQCLREDTKLDCSGGILEVLMARSNARVKQPCRFTGLGANDVGELLELQWGEADRRHFGGIVDVAVCLSRV